MVVSRRNIEVPLADLPTAIHRHALANPNKVALTDAQRSWTYRQLAAHIDALAELVATPASNQPIAIATSNRGEHLVGLLAAMSLGCPAVPLDPTAPAESLSHVQSQLTGKAITDSSHLVSAFREHGDVLEIASPEEVVHRGAARTSTAPTLSIPSVEDLAFIAPTGGTTGTPKLITLGHRASIHRFVTQAAEFGISRHSVYLSTTPIYHGAARSFCLGALYFGGSVIIQPEFDPTRFASLASAATYTFCVPTMLRRLLTEETAPLPASMSVISSGAPLPQQLAERFTSEHPAPLYDYYASVDTGGIAVLRPEEIHLAGQSVGRVALGVNVRILDENGSEQPTGSPGRIAVSGVGMGGRLNLERSEHLVLREVQLDDVGRFNEAGLLQVTGRLDDAINTGGVKIDPLAVERQLSQLPGVRHVAVVGLPDPDWGQRVVAYVVGTESETDLVEYARQHLAPPERPKQWFLVRELPLTRIGKVDRVQLRKGISTD